MTRHTDSVKEQSEEYEPVLVLAKPSDPTPVSAALVRRVGASTTDERMTLWTCP